MSKLKLSRKAHRGITQDLLGVEFGDYTVVAYYGRIRETSGNYRPQWLTKCKCGKYRVFTSVSIQRHVRKKRIKDTMRCKPINEFEKCKIKNNLLTVIKIKV